MRNNDQNQRGGRNNNSVIHNSLRTFSTYFKAVSNGASTVVKSAASAASSAIADRDNTDTSNDQVNWAGFDKLEFKGSASRRVLLLGYRFGFQVWDVEEANNVRELICRYDGPVSFMQILPKLEASKQSGDKFEDSRPLLALCADGSFSGGIYEGTAGLCNGNIQNRYDQLSGGFLPTVVWFYSFTSQSYVQMLKFRSVVYSVRCSPRVVVVLQAAQIHCFDAATLEKEYNILTNPIATNGFINGAIGLGPLAVGPRWMAYSGPPVAISNCGRVDPQHLTPSASLPGPSSSGSLVAHYAKESSKQLAAGIVTLGDKSYKKISRYYSELLPDSNNAQKTGNPGFKNWGTDTGHLPDAENIGMVIVRDVLSKSVIAQFRAHKSPISSLSFDPSGTLLVTASVQGHNINVYKITPEPSGSSSVSDFSASYVHLYRLQRGLTNAVIADVSFSDDSNWIMISSSRGTGHLFAISPSGGKVNFPYSHSCYTTKTSGAGAMIKPSVRGGAATSSLQVLNQQKLCDYGPPVALSPVSRVRSSNNGWRSAVTGAAATATGRMGTFCGIITSVFHNCKENDLSMDSSHWKPKYDLLVFSPSGCVIQYALRMSSGLGGVAGVSGISTTYDQTNECDPRLIVEAIQKWNICQKQNRRERENNSDIYGENGCSDGSKIYPEEMSKEVVLPKVDTKVRISSEERYHMYISEAELHMHLPQAPLWARSEIYFQTMIKDDSVLGEEDTLGGEIQIERFPARMVEARLKDLVPVFDHHKIPHFQMARGPSDDNFGQPSHESSGFAYSEDDITHKTSGSLDSTDGTTDEHPNGTENIISDGLCTEGFVNNRASPKVSAQLEFVNNRDSSVKNRKQNFVDNHIEDQKMGNQFGDEGDVFEV